MRTRRRAIAGFFVLSTSSMVAAQVASNHTAATAVTGTTDCRAGCQRDFNGCQESGQAAVLNASPGYHLLLDSVVKIGERKGNPGLRAEPRWDIKGYPEGSATPMSIIVKPVLATCYGEDGDTQGITYYDFQALQMP